MWSLSTSDSGNVSTTLSLRYVSVIGLMVCIALCTLSHLTSASREVISYDIPAGQESTRASQLALVAKKDDSDTGPKFAMPKKRRLQPRAAIPLHEVNMLLVVTVDGTVSAVHKTTGEILWQQEHLGGNLVSTRILQEEEGQLEDVLDDKASPLIMLHLMRSKRSRMMIIVVVVRNL
ncbi:hypothetical protein BDF22DRAFT_260252 [Syncephalis plumigaleata]|nr:hypothetical protein BDF22DRAFT_260252 [Syncephalis plumigaleata]